MVTAERETSYYPSYIFNVGVPRTLAHVLATASVINVAWKLSRH